MSKSDLKTIIIDDLPDARALLTADLGAMPGITLSGSAGSVVEGLRLIKEVGPDLVFLDIDLPDGSGFDILELVDKRDFAVIFTTASDQHAIQAFRFAAVDYLLKPIDPHQLLEAVRRVRPLQLEKMEALRNRLAGDEHRQSISLSNADEIRVVEVGQIQRCTADNNYTMFYFANGDRFLVSKTLKTYDQILGSLGFIRCHQSHIVNAKYVQGYVRAEGGYLLMKDGTQIPVSIRRKKDVLTSLSGTGSH
ncbi:MAG: LytTR family DNA-binding domain-containing protein [Saprospiraceae bacterium]|nr:LytTR family DNA-binding domain-containing protein [Saprospiraceae bacterium]